MFYFLLLFSAGSQHLIILCFKRTIFCKKYYKQLQQVLIIKYKQMFFGIGQTNLNDYNFQNQLHQSFKQRNQSQQRREPLPKQNRGIVNIGNTCYMNAVLQCLHKSQRFTSKFNQLYQSLKWEPTRKPHFNLTPIFHNFIAQMWQKSFNPYNARQIKQVIQKNNPIFQQDNQNDAMQCFLTTLSVLDDELDTSPKQKKYKDVDGYNDNFEDIYQAAKENQQTRMKSISDQTFTGRYKVIYKCCKCKKDYVVIQKFNNHCISIANQAIEKNQIVLQDCLDNFKKPEELNGDNEQYCSLCNKQTPTNKTMEIYEANNIFVICLKRFQETGKNQQVINIPHTLSVKDLLINSKAPQYQNQVYKLYAAILHSGNVYGGHYTAVCFNHNSKQWVNYNDSHTAVVQTLDLSNAYILFYELGNKHQNTRQKIAIISNNSEIRQKNYLRDQQIIVQPCNSQDKRQNFNNLLQVSCNEHRNSFIRPEIPIKTFDDSDTNLEINLLENEDPNNNLQSPKNKQGFVGNYLNNSLIFGIQSLAQKFPILVQLSDQKRAQTVYQDSSVNSYIMEAQLLDNPIIIDHQILEFSINQITIDVEKAVQPVKQEAKSALQKILQCAKQQLANIITKPAIGLTANAIQLVGQNVNQIASTFLSSVAQKVSQSFRQQAKKIIVSFAQNYINMHEPDNFILF